MKLKYELTDFSARTGYSNGIYELDIKWSEIFHAAITLGRRNMADVMYHRNFSIEEIYYRYHMIRAFLEEKSNKIGISPAYITLDPTEKVTINYMNGGVFTKIIANRVFNTPWLMHLDVYRKSIYGSGGLSITKNGSGAKPDFIGIDYINQYNVFESKGRVQYTNAALNEAYNQAKNIRMINSRLPNLKLGCLLWHNNNIFQMKIRDPEESNHESHNIKLKKLDFYFDYYFNVYNFIKLSLYEEVIINEMEFVMSNSKCEKFVLGIEKNLFEAIDKHDKKQLFEQIKGNYLENMNLKTIFQNINSENKQMYAGNDGVLFKINN